MTSLKLMSKFKANRNHLTSHMTVLLIGNHKLFIYLKQYIIPD